MYQIESIGPVIAAHRKELGMTQEQLAVRLHITAQAVSKWESGAGFPDLAMLPRIAEALSVSPNVLLGGEEEPPVREPSPEPAPEPPAAPARKETFLSRLFRKDPPPPPAGQPVQAEPPSAGQPVRSEWNGVDSVEVSAGYPCRVELQAGDGGTTVVEAQGSADFLSLLEVTGAENTLRIFVRSVNDTIHDRENNRVVVHCGFSQGKRLNATVVGSSGVHVEPAFREATLCVTGSGDISGTSFAQCDARVVGSGQVRLQESTDRLDAAVIGSGQISCEKTGDFSAAITGSGGIVCQTAGTVKAHVTGSGAIFCKDAHGTAEVIISGSGVVTLSGTVDRLHANIGGSGRLSAGRLTAKEADLEGNGTGSIVVGRVVGRCSERFDRTFNCTVSYRGADGPTDAD